MLKQIGRLVCSVPFVAACAASPVVDKYPTNFLERPYTIPKGLATFETDAALSVRREAGSRRYVLTVPLPQ